MMDILALASERLGLRRRVRLPCQVVSERDFSLVSDLCLDISPRGMCVRTLPTPPWADDEYVPAIARGTEVLVSFRVPDAGVHMDLSAIVSRVAAGRRRGESGQSLGLSFVGISALEGMILSARLKGFPPPVPLRHLRIDYAAAVRAVHASLYC
jgi:PilZ domain